MRLGIVVLVFVFLCLTGCGAFVTSPLTGVLLTDVTGTLLVEEPSKVFEAAAFGSASAESLLGIIATGDASVRAAARQGGISEIYFVDYHARSVLGIYAKYTVYVYGKRAGEGTRQPEWPLQQPRQPQPSEQRPEYLQPDHTR